MNHAGPNGQHNSCTRQQHIARGYTQQHTSLASAQHTPPTQLLCNATQLSYPFGLCLTTGTRYPNRAKQKQVARPVPAIHHYLVGTYQQIPLLRWIMQKSGSPGFLHIVRFETDASAVSSGTSTHALSARGHHELHARVLNHRFTREASRPFIVQMLATCPHNLSKDAIATSARELYQSVEDGYPLTHSASRYIHVM